MLVLQIKAQDTGLYLVAALEVGYSILLYDCLIYTRYSLDGPYRTNNAILL